MSVGLVLLLCVAVIVILVAVCYLAVCLEKKFPGEKYDERQKIARGNAYRVGYWIGAVYYILLIPYLVFGVGKREWTVEPYLLVTIGFILQTLSFHIYSLMTDAVLPLGEKPIPTIVVCFLCGGMYMANYFIHYDGVFSFSGGASTSDLQLLMAVAFFAFAVLQLIAYLRKEKE